jgi:hypothetical protein
MHNGIRVMGRKGGLDLLPIRKFAFNETGAGINSGSMAFAQVIEDGNLVPLIQQELGANAPDVTCAANHKDFHWRQNAAGSAVNQKQLAKSRLPVVLVCRRHS